MNVVSRMSYEEVSIIFDEISEKAILSGDPNQHQIMLEQWEKVLISHSWTFEEWRRELDKRLIEKHNISYSRLENKMEEDFFEGITITENSIIYSYWDTENGGRKEKIISPDKLINGLWEKVRLHDSVTLQRIFDIIETNIDLWELVTGERIKPIIEESKKPFEGSGELINLEIYWDVEHDAEYKTLTLSSMLHAIGNPTEDDYLPKELKGYIYYGISFSPNSYLKTLKLKLRNNFVIYSSDDYRDLKNFDNKEFTVLEMIKAIFWELTFFGTPADRDNKCKKLMDIREEYEKIREREEE